MRNVVGPRVLKPVSDWYESNVEAEAEAEADEAAPTVDPSRSPEESAGPETTPAGSPTAPSGSPGERPVSTESDPTPVAPPSEIDLRTHPQPRVEVDVQSSEGVADATLATDASTSLASAQAAEAFLSGADAAVVPAPTPATEGVAPAEEQDQGLVAAVIDIPKTRLQRIKAIAMAVKDRIKSHNLAVVAAGIAFWGLLAIPAVLTAVLSIYGLFAEPDKVEAQIEDNLSALPEDARSIITGQLESVAGASGGGLAVGAAIGILLALWTSSGAVAKVIATLNTIWGVTEDRKFFKLRGMAIGITFGAIVFVIGAAFLLAILPPLLSEVGLADAGRWLLNAGRFPALLAFMAVGLAVLYWMGPNRRTRFRPITWGAIVATLLWVVVSGLFSVYTASFASYNETYGSLGAVVILLMWLYLTAFMVLLGAEIDASREDLDRAAS